MQCSVRFTLLTVCFYILMKDVLHTQQRQFVEVNKVDCVTDENGETGNFPMSSIEVLPHRITQDMQSTYKRNLEARLRNHGCRGKAINITYSECVFVALVIRCALRMHPIILSSVACLAVPYFCRLSHKRAQFSAKYIY
jgi:hypothetical protein